MSELRFNYLSIFFFFFPNIFSFSLYLYVGGLTYESLLLACGLAFLIAIDALPVRGSVAE